MPRSLPERGVGPTLFLLTALAGLLGHALHVALWPRSLIGMVPAAPLYALGGALIGVSLPLWLATARLLAACQPQGILLTEGVYRLCRHPMYGNAICFTLTGLCLLWRSWVMLLVPLLALAMARLLVRREERLLARRYGAAWARYAARTPCLIPRLWRGRLPFAAPLRTGRVEPGVWGIHNLTASLFIVATETGYLAIDAGQQPHLLRRQLARLGIDGERVSDVLLTHCDPDHVGGLAAFPRARVHLGRAELPLLDGSLARTPGHHNAPISRPLHLLDDGQTLAIAGREVRVIAAPGHTPGSLAYLVDGTRLFVGDALNLKNGRACRVLKAFIMDMEAHLASIRRLAAIEGVELLCTAHGGCTANLAQAFCDWRQRRHQQLG